MKLVGHFNPGGDYPALVVPILRDQDGSHFAAYGKVLEALPSKFRFARPLQYLSRHSLFIADQFRPERNGLFAVDRFDVRAYPKGGEDEVRYFAQVLAGKTLFGASPFFKLLIAKKAKDKEHFWSAIRKCLLELGSTGFSRDWLVQQYNSAGFPVGSKPKSLFPSRNTLSIGCLPGDERSMLGLIRGFNDSDEQGATVTLLDSPSAEDRSPMFGAFLTEADADSSSEGAIALGFMEIVLGVDPEFAARHAKATSWQEILRVGAEDPDFQWIRPRADSPVGRLVEFALQDFDEEHRQKLADKVLRYAPADHETAQAAFAKRSRCMAFVMRHSGAAEIDRDIPRAEAPQFFFHKPQLLVAYELRLSNPMSANTSFRRLMQYCRTPPALQSLARAQITKLQQPAQVAAAREIASRARNIVASYSRPVAASLVLDVSGSMEGGKIEQAKLALTAFLGKFEQSRGDAIGMIAFADKVELIETGLLADRGDQILAKLAQLKAGGRTALLDAIAAALKDLRNWPNHIRTVVVLTDGLDNVSSITRSELKALVDTDGMPTILYALAYGDDADLSTLEGLAQLTGGRSFQGNFQSIGDLYLHIASLL